jgi:lysophospholipase L1-like esterase
MWRARFVVPGAALIAAIAVALLPAPASSADATLRLTVAGDEVGWLSFAVHGPRDGRVGVRELTRRGVGVIARLTLRSGKAELRRAARWRCERRTRRFEATGPGGDRAIATITTPSCADRLRLIVVPASVRPGETASASISDTWRIGGISARLCGWRGATAASCRRVRLAEGARTWREHMRLRTPGRRTISLRSAFGQVLAVPVDVRPDAQLRILVSGDSMTIGLFGKLAADLGDRAVVVGDPHPGRGITTPGGFLDWSAHAQRVARDDRPDVTIVLLGAADAGYPLIAPSGEIVACCDPPWVTEYARVASRMMTSWLRDGRGLVYWVLLPAPRSPVKARVMSAENEAIRQAGSALDDGVRVIERVAGVLSPGYRFRESIPYEGRELVVRDPDGVHLAPDGIRIAADIVTETLRGDGLVP